MENESKAETRMAAISSRLEQPSTDGRNSAEAWGRNVVEGRVIRPVLRPCRSGGGNPTALEHLVDDDGAIDSVVEGAPHPGVVKDRAARVEDDAVNVVSEKGKLLDRYFIAHEVQRVGCNLVEKVDLAAHHTAQAVARVWISKQSARCSERPDNKRGRPSSRLLLERLNA